MERRPLNVIMQEIEDYLIDVSHKEQLNGIEMLGILSLIETRIKNAVINKGPIDLDLFMN
jgi:hypothetical protein